MNRHGTPQPRRRSPPIFLLIFLPILSIASSPCISVMHTHLDGLVLGGFPLSGGLHRNLRTIVVVDRLDSYARKQRTIEISLRFPLSSGFYVDPDAPSPSDEYAGGAGYRCTSSDGASCIVRYGRVEGSDMVDIERPAYESAGYDVPVSVTLTEGSEVKDTTVTIHTTLHLRYNTPNANHRVIVGLQLPIIDSIGLDGVEKPVIKCASKNNSYGPGSSVGNIEVKTGDNRHETIVAILTSLSMMVGTAIVMARLERICVWR